MFRHTLKAILIAFLVTSTACTSTTVVNSRPQGARVYIDGAFIGEAPATHSDTVTATTKNLVKLELPGYKQTNGIIAADQWVTSKVVFSVICGAFTLIGLVGLLWSTEYRPSYEFTLAPDVGTVPNYAPAPGYGPPPTYQPAPVPGPPAYQPPPGQYQPPPQYQQQPPQYQPPQYQQAPQYPPNAPPPGYQPPPPAPGGNVSPPPPPPRLYDPDGLVRR